MIINESLVVQKDDYYPFGLTFNSYQRVTAKENRWKFSGKERITDFDLNWDDFHARQYDPALGRMLSTDPMADNRDWLSPYNYVQNNPTLRTDPTGMLDVIDINKSSGDITVTKAEGDDVVRMVDDDGNVENSYTYGENGSFNEDNVVIKNEEGTTVTNTSQDETKAEEFYEFAAQADVEFAKIDFQARNGATVSTIATSHDKAAVKNANSVVKYYYNRGYKGLKYSHTHPNGNRVPTGYYGYAPNNPYSYHAIPESKGNQYKLNDARGARVFRAIKGLENMTFEIYDPISCRVTSYTGKGKAVLK